MIQVAPRLKHQVWRYERCANKTYLCLTHIHPVFAGNNVQPYRDCSQDVQLADCEVPNVTYNLYWQQIQLYFSTTTAYVWLLSFCIQNSYDNRTKKFHSAVTGHELKLAPFMFYYPFKTGLPSPFWISLVKKVVPNLFISRPNLHLL